METYKSSGATFAPQNKTELIIIKGNGNHGKTTTCWMVLQELMRQGASVNTICQGSFAGGTIHPIPSTPQLYDFYAEVNWNGKFIVINSLGDSPQPVDAMLRHALPKQPDYIVCASRSQWRSGSTWELFETTYTNILYRRICIWPEYSVHDCDKYLVKEPAVKLIVKEMK